MQQFLTQTLDAFVPQKIKALKKNEELNKARTLIFLIFIHLIASPLLASFFLSVQHRSTSSFNVFLIITMGITGQMLALLTFRLTANQVLGGNVFALTYYVTAFSTALAISGQTLNGFLLHLFGLPLLLTFIASYNSGVIWLILVALAPVFLNFLGANKIDSGFTENWLISCFGLFVVIHVIYSYIGHLSARLHYQCSLLEVAAWSDPLTGLANRAVFESRLKESIELCKLHDTKSVLVYIDLDKFKPVNDNYGHHAGDIVLTTVANRLRHLVRNTDLVARLGGDEFAILFDQCIPDGIKPLINRIAVVVHDPINALGHHLNVDCSIGVVICPDDGSDANQLAREADSRMYAAKRNAAKLN